MVFFLFLHNIQIEFPREKSRITYFSHTLYVFMRYYVIFVSNAFYLFLAFRCFCLKIKTEKNLLFSPFIRNYSELILYADIDIDGWPIIHLLFLGNPLKKARQDQYVCIVNFVLLFFNVHTFQCSTNENKCEPTTVHFQNLMVNNDYSLNMCLYFINAQSCIA